HEILDKAWITAIFSDSQNNLWIGTQKNGRFIIDKDEKITTYNQENSSLKTNYIKTINEGKNNDIFIGTLDGLYLANNHQLSSIDLPTVDGLYLTFTSSVIHNNKLVLGALNNQLYFIDLDNYSYSFFSTENGFSYKRGWVGY